VKLIAATSLTVAAALATATFSGHRTIVELGRHDAAMRREQGELAIARESDLLAQKVAATVAVPLGNNTFSDIQPLLDDAKRDAERRGDRRIQWMLVTDVAGQTVARAGTTPEVAQLDEVVALIGEAPPGEVVRHRNGSDWIYGAAITIGKTPIGRLEMGVSTAALDAELAATIR
jgi:hypothetical protein